MLEILVFLLCENTINPQIKKSEIRNIFLNIIKKLNLKQINNLC